MHKALLLLCAGLCSCSGAGADEREAAAAGATDGPRIACGQQPTNSGEATFYDFADGSGACGFPATPDDLMVGALNAADFGNSAACGACARVVGPDASITIRVVDLCPECPKGNIDLSPEAFARIAKPELGRVAITWQYVPCDVSGPITYHFKDGSNQWWAAVQLRNIRHAVSELEFEKGGRFSALPRLSYNYFVAESGMGPGPFVLRVTDVHGSRLVDRGIALADDADREGAAQFPACE